MTRVNDTAGDYVDCNLYSSVQRVVSYCRQEVRVFLRKSGRNENQLIQHLGLFGFEQFNFFKLVLRIQVILGKTGLG